jgi:uncharacterized repeat protein (TIGR03803 family)
MEGQTVSLRKFRFKVSSHVSVVAVVFALTLLTTHAMQAQTFSVIYNLTGGTDGEYPDAGVTVGPSGALYGTAVFGGTGGAGTVFKLSQVNSSWVFSPLYEFTGGSDGARPAGGVVIGPNGALYGTTQYGGYIGGGCFTDGGCGVAYELRPPATFCRSVLCYWNETVLRTFTGTGDDGAYPGYENLAFDQAGDIYGTTIKGGAYGGGTVFELTPSGGGWTESTLHSFGGRSDGEFLYGGVVLDTAGNVYGTTGYGGTGECEDNCGTVYQLMPSNGGWVENVLVNFGGTDGSYPYGGLIIDQSGSLYGTTTSGGPPGCQGFGCGVVYKLAPSDGGFTYSALYSFSSYCFSLGGLAMDAAGNVFGVCNTGGAHGDGWIFELMNCSQACSLVDLHDFSGSDGLNPYGGPALDANGNLYGTTVYGGTGACDGGCGVVWKISGAGAPDKN